MTESHATSGLVAKNSELAWEADHHQSMLRQIKMDLGACRVQAESTAEKPFQPDFPIKFVKYAQYSPHSIKKI